MRPASYDSAEKPSTLTRRVAFPLAHFRRLRVDPSHTLRSDVFPGGTMRSLIFRAALVVAAGSALQCAQDSSPSEVAAARGIAASESSGPPELSGAAHAVFLHLDGDGRIDLALATHDRLLRLFRTNSDGRFTE